MQIILMHPRFTHARSITLTRRHLLLAFFLFLVSVAGVSSLLSYLLFRHAADLPAPLQRMVASTASVDHQGKEQFVQENLALMARKLGEMEARMMRLDALGERVQGLAGFKPSGFNFHEAPGQGGLAPSMDDNSSRPLSMSELQKLLDAMSDDLDHRSDYMNAVESALMTDKVKARMLPTSMPVHTGYRSSGFGYRVDPFTGRLALHEGLDFAAPIGTPVYAAAGGVVTIAQHFPQYGNMVEIDHGNNLATRYAHTSRILVHVGDIVRRGQHIADVGSTGRSTGPHVHFEVRYKGVAEDPSRFLAAGADHDSLTALLGK